jgi:hypothetical protein
VPVPLRTLVAVAGCRWSIETCFQTGKGLGLDEHQVRRWDSWYRHTTLVMLAHAILTVIAARQRAHPPPGHHCNQPLVALSLKEIRRLLAKLVLNTVHTADHWLGWSRWRRRHQARAKTSHYRRRGHIERRPAPT